MTSNAGHERLLRNCWLSALRTAVIFQVPDRGHFERRANLCPRLKNLSDLRPESAILRDMSFPSGPKAVGSVPSATSGTSRASLALTECRMTESATLLGQIEKKRSKSIPDAQREGPVTADGGQSGGWPRITANVSTIDCMV
mgnify:CR=1 FL=1